eukprot:jgi/Mesvir1/28970/Mv17745-RA.1
MDISSISSLLSSVIWMIALTPQLLKNRDLQAVGISTYLVLAWVTGDMSFFAGLVFTAKSMSQVCVGLVFLANDAVMLSQFFWYARPRRPNRAAHVMAIWSFFACLVVAALFYAGPQQPVMDSLAPGGWNALRNEDTAGRWDPARASSYSQDIGCVLAWMSGISYFLSRIPEIWKNFLSKSCHGLAVLTFVLAILANCLFGISMITRPALPQSLSSWAKEDLPFLIGSMGCIVFDATLVCQWHAYSNAASASKSLRK